MTDPMNGLQQERLEQIGGISVVSPILESTCLTKPDMQHKMLLLIHLFHAE
jgi:hypothetical protein